MSTKLNLNGINELDVDVTGGTASASVTSPGVTTLSLVLPGGGNIHDEPLTDGDANFIFAATLTTGGDIIVVTGVPN